jgi:hypothetical protein
MMRSPQRSRLAWRITAYAAGLLACLLVFGLYKQPEFMVMMANQLWSCF